MPKDTKKTLGRHSVGRHSVNCRGRLVNLDQPVVMGILNATPDSFFAGSRISTDKTSIDQVIEVAQRMLSEGATFLDVGGYSTRPGADAVSSSEEADRVLPVIEAILDILPETLVSIDTFRADVARQAVASGAALINDVSGGTLDPAMFATVGELNQSDSVPYILMHLRGTPQTMNSLAIYTDLMTEITDELAIRLTALRALGAKDVILDPGFGFAKTVEQNFFLLKHLTAFRVFEEPLLVGLSRKTTIWKTLKISVDEALNGTTVLNTAALLKGAAILRVHDVREAVEAINLTRHLTFF
jgi:dihydropteroate synthase